MMKAREDGNETDGIGESEDIESEYKLKTD